MDQYIVAIQKIIEGQALIIGPLAIDLAQKVRGLRIRDRGKIEIEGNPLNTLQDLVSQYEKVFGDLSVSVSKDIIKQNNISITLPPILK